MTTATATPIRCTADHTHILSGFAGVDNAPGSFGAFIADMPIGAELLSLSGWVCRWTGEYVESHGHRAARLTRVRHVDGRDVSAGLIARPVDIHTCLTNVWTATGRYTVDGAVIGVNRRGGIGGELIAVCSVHGAVSGAMRFRDAAARARAYDAAAAHARTH
ncbi:hypothetical protein NLX62_03170 [Mycobacteriaceae bacterium Msp059]|nr:hypothetical protein [Mycobacteriaceae bacterium Msp059]